MIFSPAHMMKHDGSKIFMDDYGLLYAILPDGSKRVIQTEIYGNPYYGIVRLGAELEEETE